MAIVTIFSGTFGDEEELARNVARSLDCRYVGRELLADAARRGGFCDWDGLSHGHGLRLGLLLGSLFH